MIENNTPSTSPGDKYEKLKAPYSPKLKPRHQHRPNRPGWILKRANTISLCFAGDSREGSINETGTKSCESVGEFINRLSNNDSDSECCASSYSDPIKSFCRGSLKKLQNAESKVSIAKKDVEDILDQIRRLEEDNQLLSEVQREITHLITEFSTLVTEEEERIVNKAKILEKHNSCTEFKQVSVVKSRADKSSLEESSDDDEARDFEEESINIDQFVPCL